MRRWAQRYWLSILGVVYILWCSWSLCAALEISPPPASVEVGDDVELQVTGIAAAELPKAKIIYYPRARTRARGILTWGGQPLIDFRSRVAGKYLVAVSATINGKHEYDEVEIVVGGEPEPPEPPGPDPPDPPNPPNPPDPPEPVAYLSVIVIGDKTTPAQNDVLNSAPWRDWLRSNGHQRRVWSVRETAADAQAWIAIARKRGLPRVLLVNGKAGTLLYHTEIPATGGELLDLVRSYGLAKKSPPLEIEGW